MPKTLTRAHRASAVAARPIPRADEGIVVAIVAVTGHEDSVRDIIQPGAFAHTLRNRRPKVCWMHDWNKPLGRVLHIEELLPGDKRLPTRLPDGKAWPKEAGAVVATMQFNLQTERGREYFQHAKAWAINGEAAFSIGYKVVEGMASKRSDGVRLIYRLDLFEVSLVLFGAHPMALALEVKGAHFPAIEHKHTGQLMTMSAAAAAVHEAKSLPKTQKCAKCSDMATKRIIHADGRAYQPTCDKHEHDVKGGLDEVVGVRPIEGKAAAAAVLEAKTMPPKTERKSMPRIRGSYEEWRALLNDALESLLTPKDEGGERSRYLCLDATFPDYVIATVTEFGSEVGQSWKVPYSFTGDAVTLGQAKEVELSVVVDGVEKAPKVEEGDAVRLRFIDPATASIDEATKFVHSAPEREGKSAGDGIEAAVLDLLDALIVKGYNVAGAVAGGTDSMWDEDDDMPSEHDHYTGQRKGGEDVVADADVDDEDDDEWDDDDVDDAYEAKGYEAWEDDRAIEEDDAEQKGDEDPEADEQITLDPMEVKATLDALRAA